jgi:hypothetical protein
VKDRSEHSTVNADISQLIAPTKIQGALAYGITHPCILREVVDRHTLTVATEMRFELSWLYSWAAVFNDEGSAVTNCAKWGCNIGHY